MSPAEERSVVGPLDAVHTDPDHHDVLMENEHVRVLDALLRPGEQTEIHTHVWPSVPPHRVRNVGNADLLLMAVELKSLR